MIFPFDPEKINGYVFDGFHDTLEHFVPQSGFTGNVENILVIGSGYSFEGYSAGHYFGERNLEGASALNIISVDIDQSRIDGAEESHESYCANPYYSSDIPKMSFITADARDLSGIVDNFLDVAIYRHPYECTDNDNIFWEVYDNTRFGGLLFVTVLNSGEAEGICKSIKRSGFSVEVAQKNPYSVSVVKTGFSILGDYGQDYFVISAIKQKEFSNRYRKIKSVLLNWIS